MSVSRTVECLVVAIQKLGRIRGRNRSECEAHAHGDWLYQSRQPRRDLVLGGGSQSLGDRYADTWQHDKHGGPMWGMIERTAPSAHTTPAKPKL